MERKNYRCVMSVGKQFVPEPTKPEAIELVPRLLIKARLDNGKLTVEILGRARGERARNLQVLGSQTISV